MSTNAIDFAVDDVITFFNKRVLEKAFRDSNNIWERNDNRTIDALIKEKLIYGFVFRYINAVAGEMVTFNIAELPITILEGAARFDIPFNKTKGKRIISAHAVEMSSSEYDYGIQTISGQAAETAIGPRGTGTARIELGTTPNTIYCYEWSPGIHFFIRCVLENDKYLNNIPSSYWPKFADLVKSACKIYIYNQLGYSTGDDESYGGQPSSYWRTIIDSYSNAEEEFQEKLQKWIKVNFMADRNEMRRYITGTVGSRLI